MVRKIFGYLFSVPINLCERLHLHVKEQQQKQGCLAAWKEDLKKRADGFKHWPNGLVFTLSLLKERQLEYDHFEYISVCLLVCVLMYK